MNRRDEHLTAVIRDLDPERDPAGRPGAAPEKTRRRHHVPVLAAVAVLVVAAGVGAVRSMTSHEVSAADRPAVTLPVPEEPYDAKAWERTGGCLSGRNNAAVLDYAPAAEGDRTPDVVLRRFERDHLVNRFSGGGRRAITSVAAMQVLRGRDRVEATYFSPEGLPVAHATIGRVRENGTWVLGSHWTCV